MSDNNSSTIKSYVDSAIGAGQSALGSVTGNTGDKVIPPFLFSDGCHIRSPPLASPPPFHFVISKKNLCNRNQLMIIQVQGETTKDKAAAENDASHTIGKLGPYAVSSSGGVSSDDPRRTEGSWDQTLGSAKESIGNMLGADGLKREGQQQNAQGKGMEAEGQLSDFGSGIKGRAEGAIKGMGAGITGDREKQDQYQMLHDDAKTQQRSAEQDIQRSANA